MVLTAGMTPRVDGVVQFAGQVGTDVSLADAQAAAAIAAGNALAAALAVLDADQQFDQVLRMTVYVNAAPGFDQHTAVADGASARLRELLGDRGKAARAAVGVTSLPGGACVELELTCAWRASGE
jgi:enamine deaminase RidA (YjgF/YER057c/UK114 family)